MVLHVEHYSLRIKDEDMIYIRVDGNGQIGMGHVMRCIAIAHEIKKLGEELTFVLAGEEPMSKIKEEGFSCVAMQTDYRNMEEEWCKLDSLLPQGGKVLLDSYFATKEYMEKLSSKCKVIYIDDMNKFEYPVDCIVNGNIYGEEEVYTASKVLGGCKYSPLRHEFSEARENRKPEYLLLTTGSSDPYSITLQIVQGIIKSELLMKMPLKVVCGRYNQDYEEVVKICENHSNIEVLQNVPDMWNVMSKAMVAITAGGTTMNELSCMGVPMICFSFVDNQEQITSTYYTKGYVYFAGDYLVQKESMIPTLCKALEELVTDEELRENYSKKQRMLVDGLGSKRIAEEILKL